MINISVLDYGLGNTKSICNAIEKSGVKVKLTKTRDEILSSDGLILPGVGAFSHGMERLINQKIDVLLREFVDTGKPLLGICLGMQMLFDQSTEFGISKGLCLIPGKVQLLEISNKSETKLPHVSWNSISKKSESDWKGTILESLDNGEDMYFVHSYYAMPANASDVLSITSYDGFEFCSTVKHKNIYGCQYHPEKSAAEGLKIINNFVSICKRGN